MSDDTPAEKYCSKCGETKSVEEFYKKKTSGYQSQCKACRRQAVKAYHDANLDKIQAYREANAERIRKNQHAYYMANAEAKSEYNKAYQAANSDHIRELKRAHREANSDAIREYNSAYYVANKEKIAARVRIHRSNPEVQERLRAWRTENADKLRELNRGYNSDPNTLEHRKAIRQAYMRANPDVYRAAKQRRRALIMGNGGTFTSKELKDMRKEQAGICAYCKDQHKPNKLTIDHVIPLKQGGRHEAPNIVLACTRCNYSKNNRTPEQWVQRWYLRKDNKTQDKPDQ